eukprot:s1570_g6.t1
MLGASRLKDGFVDTSQALCVEVLEDGPWSVLTFDEAAADEAAKWLQEAFQSGPGFALRGEKRTTAAVPSAAVAAKDPPKGTAIDRGWTAIGALGCASTAEAALRPMAVVGAMGRALARGGVPWRLLSGSEARLLVRRRDLVGATLAARCTHPLRVPWHRRGGGATQALHWPVLQCCARLLAQEPGRSPPCLQMRAVQNEVSTADPAQLEFETYKFNLAWTKMKQAEENNSPDLPELKKEVEDLAKMVESLGGSKPAEMMTLDEAEKRVKAVREDLSFEKLWNMSGEERWLLAQGAYTASIPFKPLIYIGGILLTPWVADNVMPLIGQALNMFRLPDEEESLVGSLYLGDLWCL